MLHIYYVAICNNCSDQCDSDKTLICQQQERKDGAHQSKPNPASRLSGRIISQGNKDIDPGNQIDVRGVRAVLELDIFQPCSLPTMSTRDRGDILRCIPRFNSHLLSSSRSSHLKFRRKS